MIDRYHLRYFLAVVDTGNFSRAAAACNVAQPTLSVGIARLEASLGRTLFNRTNRRVALTEAGAGLLAHARAIESGFAAAERAVTGSASAPLLRLGVLTTIPRHWIERWLATRSGERVELVEGNERDLRARLARGRIDAALTILRDGDDRSTGQHLLTEGYALAIGATHPLAARASLRAEEIAHEPMIVRRHCEMLSETSRFFTARGVRPFFPARTTSDDRALSHVRARLGITVMPDGFHAEGVARVPLEDFDATRDIGLVFATHVAPDPALIAGLREALS
jgi:DNA-binding transcriptional LysR family regulator